MEITTIAELLQVALPTGLITVGIWWGSSQGWPYWKERDAEERARRHEQRIATGTSQQAMATHLAVIANVLANPVRVVIGDDGRQNP
ncbi:MAG: hypothetical protein KAT00_01890 [Planctomycetes bacterium]|nr:hypothetical protein [Planctomycetota bacterium]